jgi:hypothetical protein
MKLGCLGCLGVIIVILVVGVVVGAFVLLSGNVLEIPDVKAPQLSRSDGYSAQQKLFEIVARQAGRSSRRDPVVLTEREINSFLAYHLADSARIPLDPIITRLTRGSFEVQGKTVLRNLVQAAPFAQLMPYLPAARLDTPVWVTVRGTVGVEPVSSGSQRMVARVRLDDLTLGKQPLSASLLPLVLGRTAGRLTEFPVPSNVDSIQIEDGRAIVRTR